MLPFETVTSGARHPRTKFQVLQSGAGYYLGYLSKSGEPYSRESGYFATREAADLALADWLAGNSYRYER